jgi:hypothetical protein
VGSGTLITPGTGVGLIIDWIQVSADAQFEIWHGTSQNATNTIGCILSGALVLDYRSPSHGTGLRLNAGEILKYVAVGNARVAIGYHLDGNA